MVPSMPTHSVDAQCSSAKVADLPPEVVALLMAPLPPPSSTEAELLAKTVDAPPASEEEYQRNLAHLVGVRELVGKVYPSTKK